MRKLPTKVTAVAATVAAAALGGSAIAGAAGSGSTTKPGSDPALFADDAGPGPRTGGPGGHGPRADLTAVAKTLGVTEAKLRSALDAARPTDRPAKRGDDLAATLAKALGASTADVQSVLEANRPDRSAGRPAPGTKPDSSALAAALARNLSVSQDRAQAALDAAFKAHQADHATRETAMYAAVARALGKDAAAVQKAFEANRPTR